MSRSGLPVQPEENCGPFGCTESVAGCGREVNRRGRRCHRGRPRARSGASGSALAGAAGRNDGNPRRGGGRGASPAPTGSTGSWSPFDGRGGRATASRTTRSTSRRRPRVTPIRSRGTGSRAAWSTRPSARCAPGRPVMGGYGDQAIPVAPAVALFRSVDRHRLHLDADMRATQGAIVRQLLPHVRDIRQLGTARVNLCFVAAGRVNAFYEWTLSPWSRAAGAIIAREAGATSEGPWRHCAQRRPRARR